MKQIVVELFNRCRVDLPSYEAFAHLYEEGRVVLLFDGFDELASRSDPTVTLENFREINRSAMGRAKLVMSCRTHYFVDDAQVHNFQGESKEGSDPVYTDLYQEIAGRRNFQIRHVEDFEPAQISALIKKRLGDEAEAGVWSVLREHYNLADLARRPVLLDMILESLDKIRTESGDVTSAVLYQVYTDIWLERNDWRTKLEPIAREVLIEEIAARMTSERRMAIRYTEIPQLIRDTHPDIDEPRVDQCDRELRRAGFLVRNRSGSYRFAHRSFQEFFLAKYIVRRMRTPGRDQSRTDLASLHDRVTTVVFRFVCDLVRRDATAISRGADRLQEEDLSGEELCLTIKFLSRSQEDEVIDSLRHLVERLRALERDRAVSLHAHDFHRTRPLAYAVTALGWLQRDDNPKLFRELLLDEDEAYMVRHNALIALWRSRHPSATAAIQAFIATCEPRSVVTLFSSRIMAAVVKTGERPEIADAVLERWSADRGFAARWETSGAGLSSLCSLCESSTRGERGAILRHIALTAFAPRAVAAAVMALGDDDLADVEASVLRRVSEHRSARRYAAMAQAVARFVTDDAAEQLVRMLGSGEDQVAEIALRTLCVRWPEHARAAIYGGSNPWKGRHWATRLFLIAGELLGSEYPYEVKRSVKRVLGHKRVSSPEAFAALRILSEVATDEFSDLVEELFRQDQTAAVLGYACERLYQIDPAAAKAAAIAQGLAASSDPVRRKFATLLRAETDEEVTAALFEAIQGEGDLDVRAELARALVAPGRTLARRQLTDAIAVEHDEEVRQILELGVAGAA